MVLLLMMNNRTRTVIEVSGRQHYPDVEPRVCQFNG